MKKVEAADWQGFLSDAERTGALIKTPPGKTAQSWVTTLRVLQIYGNTPLTVRDLGEMFFPQMSRQAVDARFRTGALIVHERLPQGIQDKYPLKGLLQTKPESLTKRIARSRKVKGLVSVVFDSLSETGGDVTKAIQRLNLTDPRQKTLLKIKLRKLGLIESAVAAASIEPTRALRDPEIPIEQKRELTSGVTRHMLQTNKKGDNPLFISVQTLLGKANFPYAPTKVEPYVERLKEAGYVRSIPHLSGKWVLHYHFLLTQDLKNAVALLQKEKAPQKV